MKKPLLEEITGAPDAVAGTANGEWILEGYFDESGRTTRTNPLPFPCRVGRGAGADVVLPYPSVSSVHALLYLEDGEIRLQDLASTNGTFVNRERVSQITTLEEGDVIHFGEHEVRLVRNKTLARIGTVQLDLNQISLPNRMLLGIHKLHELLDDARVEPHFQPIVDLKLGRVMGYEVLGRGAHPDLPVAPYELFCMAEQIGLEAELSILFRDRGVEVGQRFANGSTFYVNTHAVELYKPDLLFASLTALRERQPEAKVVLEVHESAVLGSAELGALRGALNELGIQLAYDDFGAGRSRLAELLEFPPEVVKFDMSIVRDLHLAKPSKVKMVGSLVSMLLDEGVACLAEGVESEQEAEACRDLGFDLAQGFLFGRPRPFRDHELS